MFSSFIYSSAAVAIPELAERRPHEDRGKGGCFQMNFVPARN